MNATTFVEGKEVLNSTLTRDFLCAECFSGLREVMHTIAEGKKSRLVCAVICADNPAHRGYIPKSHAAYLESEKELAMAQARAVQKMAPVLRSLGQDDDFEGFD